MARNEKSHEGIQIKEYPPGPLKSTLTTLMRNRWVLNVKFDISFPVSYIAGGENSDG